MVMWARELAASNLADALPQRWRHVQAVGAKAENLRLILGGDADLAVAAAWLHDIGYAPSLVDSGFHHLDGARFLRALNAEERLCGLVANHSAGRWEADLRGLGTDLAQFPDEQTLARDVVWFCDMTTSPTGDHLSFEQRLADIRDRYSQGHTVYRSIAAAVPEIRAAITHVSTRVEVLTRAVD
jgi:putative nucleotidyltransferase with HDIG domain